MNSPIIQSFVKHFSFDERSYQEIPDDKESGARNERRSWRRSVVRIILAIATIVGIAVVTNFESSLQGGEGGGYSSPYTIFDVNLSDFIPSVPFARDPAVSAMERITRRLGLHAGHVLYLH
jgi:hypothetical protein